jgi:hypothetical protein
MANMPNGQAADVDNEAGQSHTSAIYGQTLVIRQLPVVAPAVFVAEIGVDAAPRRAPTSICLYQEPLIAAGTSGYSGQQAMIAMTCLVLYRRPELFELSWISENNV